MPKDVAADQLVETRQAHADSPVTLPSGEFIANAAFSREGGDLVLTGPDGNVIVVEGYFSLPTPPDLVSLDGAQLSPSMVDAFLPPQHTAHYAANAPAISDVSAAGQITEVAGTVTITRADGTKVTATPGTKVFAGDVIETSADGAANILFADNTTFAISESARLSVDEFAFNAAEQSGSSFFSMLQGVFVYTSGLIGKNDPASVNIDTPVGSIGIRGTVVAGKIAPAGQESAITIVDGAIVVSNSAGTIELNESFETASLSAMNQAPDNIGQISVSSFTQSYSSAASVAGDTFNAVGNGSFGQGGDSVAPGTDSNATDGPQGALSPAPPSEAAAPAPFTSEAAALTTAPPAAGAPGAPPSAPPMQTAPPPPGAPPTGQMGLLPPPPPGDSGAKPPPPGGPNDLRFIFSNEYRGKPQTMNDDGIPLFAMGWPGMIIGNAIVANETVNQSDIRYVLNYTDTGGNTTTVDASGLVRGRVFVDNTGSPALYDQMPSSPGEAFMEFNATTGALTITNPTGFDIALNNNYTYTLQAVDTANGNTVIASESFVLRLLGNSTGSTVYLGTSNPDGNVGAGPIGTGGIIINAANSTILAREGGDRVEFSSGAGNTTTFMGQGNDLAVVNTSTGVLTGSIDGGMGNDKVALLGTGTRDLTAANSLKLHNIEQLNIGMNVIVKLTIKEIFEMTDPTNRSLRVEAVGTASATLDVELNDFTLLLGNPGTLGNVNSEGDVTYRGTYNNQTVTLVIAQGGSTDGIITTDTAV